MPNRPQQYAFCDSATAQTLRLFPTLIDVNVSPPCDRDWNAALSGNVTGPQGAVRILAPAEAGTIGSHTTARASAHINCSERPAAKDRSGSVLNCGLRPRPHLAVRVASPTEDEPADGDQVLERTAAVLAPPATP